MIVPAPNQKRISQIPWMAHCWWKIWKWRDHTTACNITYYKYIHFLSTSAGKGIRQRSVTQQQEATQVDNFTPVHPSPLLSCWSPALTPFKFKFKSHSGRDGQQHAFKNSFVKYIYMYMFSCFSFGSQLLMTWDCNKELTLVIYTFRRYFVVFHFSTHKTYSKTLWKGKIYIR